MSPPVTSHPPESVPIAPVALRHSTGEQARDEDCPDAQNAKETRHLIGQGSVTSVLDGDIRVPSLFAFVEVNCKDDRDLVPGDIDSFIGKSFFGFGGLLSSSRRVSSNSARRFERICSDSSAHSSSSSTR